VRVPGAMCRGQGDRHPACRSRRCLKSSRNGRGCACPGTRSRATGCRARRRSSLPCGRRRRRTRPGPARPASGLGPARRAGGRRTASRTVRRPGGSGQRRPAGGSMVALDGMTSRHAKRADGAPAAPRRCGQLRRRAAACPGRGRREEPRDQGVPQAAAAARPRERAGHGRCSAYGPRESRLAGHGEAGHYLAVVKLNQRLAAATAGVPVAPDGTWIASGCGSPRSRPDFSRTCVRR